MKAYGELLNGNTTFRAPVLDVQEFLADRGLLESFRTQMQPLPGAVAMHDACHMIHGQGIQAQPRQLLRAIPEIQLREATEAGVLRQRRHLQPGAAGGSLRTGADQSR